MSNRAVGLFAGIGGIERGLHQAGWGTQLLCEIDSSAQRVLEKQFPGVPVEKDVCKLRALPEADLLVAGFPCQDLSQAGKTAGIRGKHSGLVAEVFRLLARRGKGPRWVLLENVPFMLQLQRGKAMRVLITALEELGYAWAYRIVDTRAFGLPQRRQRVLLLASKTEDPRSVLLHGSVEPPPFGDPEKVACGFYWTEGLKGLGWGIDAVPTLKGGSTIGIPSPPAIRMPHTRMIVTPEIRDAERLQGFPADWTLPATEGAGRKGPRWRLVGNAVSVPVAQWLGERLGAPVPYNDKADRPLPKGAPWPRAAWGKDGKACRADLSTWPVRYHYHHLADFLEYPTAPLSERATAGFKNRVDLSTTLRFPKDFERDVARHLAMMRRAAAR